MTNDEVMNECSCCLASSPTVREWRDRGRVDLFCDFCAHTATSNGYKFGGSCSIYQVLLAVCYIGNVILNEIKKTK